MCPVCRMLLYRCGVEGYVSSFQGAALLGGAEGYVSGLQDAAASCKPDT